MIATIIGILLVLAAVLFVTEIFFVPGTAIPGIFAGIFLIAANAMTYYQYGVTAGILLTACSAVAIVLFFYWITRSKSLRKLALDKEIHATSATKDQLSVQVGDCGVTTTRLALVGNALIEGKNVEVKSASGYLDPDTNIVVTRVDEAQITVQKA